MVCGVGGSQGVGGGEKKSGQRDGVEPDRVDFWHWYRRLQFECCRCGLMPWEFLGLTPGEVETVLAAESSRQEAAWLLTAWQTSRIGPMVWANKSYSPNELLGWSEERGRDRQVGKVRVVAFLRSLGDEVKRNQSGA